jgi:predicted component of type VI protein secretion system
MEKVARGPVPTTPEPEIPEAFLISVDAAVSVEELQALWNDSVKAGYSDKVSKIIAKKKREFQ